MTTSAADWCRSHHLAGSAGAFGQVVSSELKSETELGYGRYNTVNGQLAGIANDITVKRSQVGGGWFVTPNVLSKVEFVRQNYEAFPTSDIRAGGKFQGFMVEGVVAF